MELIIKSLFLTILVFNTNSAWPAEKKMINCDVLVIAHRGASGYVPEHTIAAYSLAIAMGADYIEPDLVMTSDGHLVSRHDNELSITTDVSSHKEFENRKTTKNIDGVNLTGWFTEDFTLAELKTLRAKERIPETRPGNARMDGVFEIPTFQEIINLVKSMKTKRGQEIGIYPEIKHSTYFQNLNLPMEKLVIETLERNGYSGENAPIFIQSFEISNLKYLRTITQFKLVQLLDSENLQPFDQIENSSLTYKEMATPEGLASVASYADAVGPDKSYIFKLDDNNNLKASTSFVSDAHNAGLKVHAYTFRAENSFLPTEMQDRNKGNNDFGDIIRELIAFMDVGVDGFFIEQPDFLVRLREQCNVL